MARTAHIVRETNESHIDLELNLDGTGKAKYRYIRAVLQPYDDRARQAFADRPDHPRPRRHRHRRAPHCGRYGHRVRRSSGRKPRRTRKASAAADATVPLDEALAKAVVDISGRPYRAAASPKATSA